ncbi:Fic family protein [Pelobacter propionicus]|uniref:Filamentation induced by cAMP protein Fic n=1 Tax=Pelobacter propionicus (strain DSM 2379 / NBRC 103807 / OttBd1) TaxID=338966 RepID=A1ARC2_PELPD|nr:Fic family protein [Pelobacter propionicus]ABK99892.1 filamentation induced by cAMP protein Fic [Pelobacter propionicus DSM 2379]
MKYQNRLTDNDKLHEKIRSHRPLDAYEVKQLKEYYRIGLTWSSNALEGNSLTESETKVVLEDGITIGGKPLKDHFEAVGHSEAFDLLYKLAGSQEITEDDILGLHRLFYYRIQAETAGKYRDRNVIITGTDFTPPPPSDIPLTMQDFINSIPSLSLMHPVEYAAMLHLNLVTIHPFIDGNGRTARLLMNLALLQAGYPITIIPPIIRGDYISVLRDSNKGDNQPFVNFISCCVWESQKEYLRLLESLDRK